MTRVFHAAALVLSAAVLFVIYRYTWRFVTYPIELEWREGSIWLHALAQSYGVNIFQDEHLAYVNANHGVFDHVIKGALVRAFRFLEPQYILRIFVLIFPAVSVLAIFVRSRRHLPATAALISALCLGCAMLLAVHDLGHWNTFIGRSDPTAFTLLVIAYLCYAPDTATFPTRILRHLSYLTIALVLSTNWRIYPVALTIPLIMEQRRDTLRIRELLSIYLLIAGYTLATCAFFIVGWFHADASAYWRYFFGFFGTQSPLPPSAASFQKILHYVRTPAVAALVVFSALPVLLEAGRHVLRRSGHWPSTLAALATLASLVLSVLAFKMNFSGGGFWYLCPQAILLVIYYNTRYDLGPGIAAGILVFGLGVLWRSDNLPLMTWYYRNLGDSLPAARQYTEDLVRLDNAFGVYTEEAQLFKRSRNLPPIDMGDVAEIFANANYYGPRVTAVVSAQKSRIIAHEPVLVFVGTCASSALKQLAANEEYCLLLKSPTIAIGGEVYVRMDHLEEVRRFLRDHAAPAP